jgi:hypothetical protein
MTLLSRTPREVYRVYSEDDFLADPICGEPLQRSGAAAGSRRLHRLAGVTLLIVAASAVGGSIVLTSVQSLAEGRRRVRARSEAASEPLAAVRASRPSVWRQRVTGGRARTDRGNVSHHTARQHGRVPAALVARQKLNSAEPPVLARERAITPAPQSGPPVEVVAAAGPEPALATVADKAGESGQAEFGFER